MLFFCVCVGSGSFCHDWASHCSVLFWSLDALFVFGLPPFAPLGLLTRQLCGSGCVCRPEFSIIRLKKNSIYSRGPSLQDQTWCQILGLKPGPVAEFKNWDLRVSVSVCVCVYVCCFLSFSVFLCLSLSFSVFLCLSLSFSAPSLQSTGLGVVASLG